MKFETKIMAVEAVTDHPNADRLSIIKLKGYDYKIVSAKLEDGSNRYRSGDWVIYVQADSIVPEYLLKKGFWNEEKGIGFLSGKLGNRVKPIKLRGITSEGILFPVEDTDYWEGDCMVPLENGERYCAQLGEDVAERLGITKYEPEIPASMSGDLLFVGNHNTVRYDIENAKKFPGKLDATNQKIYLTEKLHGTFCGIGWLPDYEHPELFTNENIKGSFVVFSKGLGAKGLVFKNNLKNKDNLYVRVMKETNIIEKMIPLIHMFNRGKLKPYSENFFILGEIFGKGVQDLHYGLETPQFRGFEIKIADRWTDADEKYDLLESVGIPAVPLLAIVNNEAAIPEYVDGKSSFLSNIREGVVAIPEKECYDEELGRIILKYVSDDYLNRKGETTEYQ
jgi:RNA ligase (TIGR02306 family)